MNEENDKMVQLEARIAALEAKNANGAMEMNTDSLVSFPQFDVGMPPIVPVGGRGMFDWDAKKKQIKGGFVMVGRSQIKVAASSENLADHEWAICVTFSENQVTAEYYQWDMHNANTDTETYLRLYKVVDGKMTEDYRGTFMVQCWE